MPKKYKYTKYFTYDGHRYVVRANSMEELYEKKANKIRDFKEGRVILSGSTTVKQWAIEAFNVYKSKTVSEEVLRQSLLRVNKYILSEIGNMPLKDVKPIQCQAIMNEQEGKSYSHCHKLMLELKFIFKTAQKDKLIIDNPAEDITLPNCTKGKRRSLTNNERKHLIAVCSDDPNLKLFLIMLYTGARPSEAISMTGNDIVEHEGHLLLHIRGTKTANSDRYVPLKEELYPFIKDTPRNAPLAPNQAGRAHTRSSYLRAIERLKRKMNISMGCRLYRNQLVPPYPLAADFVPYYLRHTYCTDLQKDGVDVRDAQKLMGHSTITLTADIYSHTDQDRVADISDQIGGVVVGEGVAAGVALE